MHFAVYGIRTIVHHRYPDFSDKQRGWLEAYVVGSGVKWCEMKIFQNKVEVHICNTILQILTIVRGYMRSYALPLSRWGHIICQAKTTKYNNEWVSLMVGGCRRWCFLYRKTWQLVGSLMCHIMSHRLMSVDAHRASGMLVFCSFP